MGLLCVPAAAAHTAQPTAGPCLAPDWLPVCLQLLRMDPHHHGPLHGPALWSDEAGLSDDALIAQFQRECHVVRKGLEGDLAKLSCLILSAGRQGR